MKFSLSWLKEYLETDNNLDEILHWLTMVGLEVEKVEDQAQLVKDFVIGHIRTPSGLLCRQVQLGFRDSIREGIH